MARGTSVNYSAAGTQFTYATATTDLFQSGDVQLLAQAVEGHTHASTRGLGVARLGAGATGADLTLSGTLLFTADNTYDVGASGATRPRDLYLARNEVIGGQASIGATSLLAGAGLYVATNATTTGVSQYGVAVSPVFSSAATTSVDGVNVQWQTAAVSFTIASGYGVRVNSPVINSPALATTVYGVYAANQGGARATNAYGVYIAAQSGSAGANIGLYNLGSSRFDGNIGLGAAPVTNAILYAATPSTQLATATQYGLLLNPNFSTAATSYASVATLGFTTAASGTATINAGYGLDVSSPTVLGSFTVTSIYGVHVANQGGAARTNAYGVYIETQSGASGTNMGLYNNSSSQFNGTIGIGTAPIASEIVRVNTSVTGAATAQGMNFRVNGDSTATAGLNGYAVQMGTNAGSYTIPSINGFYIDGPVLSANTNVTTVAGIRINNQGATGVTNAYGLYISAISGASSTNIGLYNAGTTTLVGAVTLPSSTVTTANIQANAVTNFAVIQSAPSGSTTSSTLVACPAPYGTTGATVTVASGDTVIVMGTIHLYTSSTVPFTCGITIYMDGSAWVGVGGDPLTVSSGTPDHIIPFVVVNAAVTPGSHTFTVYWQSNGTATINFQTGVYSFLTVMVVHR